MTLLAHLRELRRRVSIAAAAVLLAGVAGFFLSDPIIEAAAEPLQQITRGGLNFTTLGGAFDLRFRVAMTVGVLLASPVWLWQLWAFLVPGLSSRERRLGLAFMSTAVPLFLLGGLFGWMLMPHMVMLLTGFAPADSSSMISASEYFDFLLRMVLAIGVAFVSPVAMVALNAVGVLSAQAILRGWRVALIAIVIFSAVVTPASDVLSMGLVAAPLIVLYAATAMWTWLHDRRAARRSQLA